MAYVTGNPEFNFFEQNPELRYLTEFNKLIERIGEEEASKLMWCAYMIEDPKSKIFNMPRDEKMEEVRKNYHNYSLVEYKRIYPLYGRLCIEKEEYMYNIHIEKLDELTLFLQELKLSKNDDFIKYTKIIDKLPKVWDSLEKVKAKMIAKTNKSGLRGGAKRSAREKRV